jgi:hypothetical protein
MVTIWVKVDLSFILFIESELSDIL